MPILSWNVPLTFLLFLKRSLVFPILLFSSILCTVHLRRPSCFSLLFSAILHSVDYMFPFLPWLLFLFFPRLFVKPPQTTLLPSYISFSLGWFWPLSSVQCYNLVHNFSSTLSTRFNHLHLFVSPLYTHKGFDLGHTWIILVAFPNFFSLSLNFAIRSCWSESQSAPGLIFTGCIERLHLLLQRT